MKKVFLQLPDGLKIRAIELAEKLESEGKEVIISGDSCFGACDLRFLDGYKTLQYGHSKMIDAEAEYEPWRIDQDLVPIALKALPRLKGVIGLASTIQHSHLLSEVRDAFEKQGTKSLLVPKGDRCSEEGQVLGCDLTGPSKIKDKVDMFLFIGTGAFHAMGISYYTKKPVVRADPLTGEIAEVDGNNWLKESALRQTKAFNAKSFGIIVSVKPGQRNIEKAKEIKKRFENKGLKAFIIALDDITPEKLLGFKVDAFVITACPRIVIDDWKNYQKAVLLPEETENI